MNKSGVESDSLLDRGFSAASLGADGVPFFLFDRTKTVSGAQPTEFFLNVLQLVGGRGPPP